MSSIILNAQGDPEAPTYVVDALRRLSPRFGLRLVKSFAGHYWNLDEEWKDGDPRWAMVQSGQVARANARDIIQMFPKDCPVDAFAAYIRNRWGPRAIEDPKKEAEKAVAEVKKQHKELKENQMDNFMVRQEEQVKGMSDHQRRVLAGAETAHPMVHGFDLPKTPKKGRSSEAA